jgi:hypothetical protein
VEVHERGFNLVERGGLCGYWMLGFRTVPQHKRPSAMLLSRCRPDQVVDDLYVAACCLEDCTSPRLCSAVCLQVLFQDLKLTPPPGAKLCK